MKRIAQFIAFALCLVFVALPLASCGKANEGEPDAPDTTAVETAAVETAASETTASVPTADSATAADTAAAPTVENTTVVTTDKWAAIAPKITMIAERDRTLKIECSIFKNATKASKNDIYLKGPDAVEDGVTPLIQQMVYERNRAAEELLHTTTEFVFWDFDFGEQAPQIDLVVKGKDADAPDLFVNMMNDLNKEVVNSVFKDVWSIQNGYFDFTAEGWLTAWMENLSFSGDRAYILGSDYFLDVFRGVSVLPFNMTLMDANADKLAPAILEEGETLGAGEDLTTYFFDLVEEGNWTWDVLGKLCEAIWVDADNDGQDSIADTLGIIATEYGGDSAAGYIYSCGEKLTETYIVEDESSEYNGKQWIKYADDSTILNKIFDAVKTVFDGPGSLSTNATTHDGNTPENPGLAYHQTKFAAGELLFVGVHKLGALENEPFQQMYDLWSVVPCPKADAAKPYNSMIYNTSDAGAINVNANPRKARVLSAFIQYCTENSPAIREQFLQIVTKYKTTTYDQGTDRMFDIIYDGILWGRDYWVESENMEPRWHTSMRQNKFAVGSDYISQLYATNRSMKQTTLDRVMKKWYTLPTAKSNAE